jgi:branched-chain amino acid transport system substrate-binding protein
VETIHGRLRFDGPGNYGDDLMKIKQVQNGKWVVVHPAQFAPAGVKLQVN